MSDYGARAVVVTGATGELGRAVTAAFLDAGAHVAAPYRSEERAEALRAHIPDAGERLLLVRAEVADEEAMRNFTRDVVERWGRIDALAALAGGTAMGEVIDTGIEAFQSLFDQNLATALVSIHAVLPHMRARGYGRIVCVGARAALRAAKGMAAYSTAKAGVVRLVEALAEEVKEEGITANAVVPSIIDHPENRRRYPKADPRKWVSPAELAAVIRFLCSSESSGITGAAIPVFGRI